MKFFISSFLVFLLCKQTICFYTVDSSLINLIQSREILENEKIVSIENLLNNDTNIDTLMSNYSNTVYTTLKCKYADVIIDLLQTFYEIYKYAGNILKKDNTPNLINSLISVTEIFYNIKSPVAKMINNLFSYSDEYPELRTGDPSLLMSLLTIQFFLYNRNKDPLIVYNNETMIPKMERDDLKKTLNNLKNRNSTIVQMIGLIEKFRHKWCVIHNPYKKNEEICQKLISNKVNNENKFKNILDPNLDIINSLVNHGSDNYEDFNNKVYDPENLFFENIDTERFKLLKNIKVLWDFHEAHFYLVYDLVKNDNNIKNILKFQYVFVSLIADMFNAQIYNLLTSPPNDKSISHNVLQNFQLFIDRINFNNILINVPNIIIVPILLLQNAFDKYDESHDQNFLNPIIEKFEFKLNKKRLFKNTKENVEDNPSLVILFNDIIKEKQFIDFSRIFNFLSYHLYTESSNHIIDETINLEIIYLENKNEKELLEKIHGLQYCLFAFRILLEINIFHKIYNDALDRFSINLNAPALTSSSSHSGNLDFEHPEMSLDIHNFELDGYGRDFGYIMTTLVMFYNHVKDFPELQYILLPLLIRFRHTNKYLCQTNKYELIALHQTVFLTITQIENYILEIYSLPICKYSLEIFTKHFINETQEFNVNLLQCKLLHFVENSSFTDILAFIIDFYNKNMPSTFLLNKDGQIKMDWNGSKEFGHDVLRNVSKMVIDGSDVLNFLLFATKWLLANILIKIFNALLIINNENCSDHPDVINIKCIDIKLNELDEISEMKLPTPARSLLVYTIEVARTTLDIKSIGVNTKNIELCRQLINDNLKMLGVHQNEKTFDTFNTIDEILETVTIDIKNLKDHLKVISVGLLKPLFSNDLGE